MAVLANDRGERPPRRLRCAQVRIRFEARDDERVGSQRLVPNRVQSVFDDTLEGDDVRGFTVGLDDRDVDEPRLDLHERVREALEAVPRDGARRAEGRPELVRDEFVEDPEALVVVLCTSDE